MFYRLNDPLAVLLPTNVNHADNDMTPTESIVNPNALNFLTTEFGSSCPVVVGLLPGTKFPYFSNDSNNNNNTTEDDNSNLTLLTASLASSIRDNFALHDTNNESNNDRINIVGTDDAKRILLLQIPSYDHDQVLLLSLVCRVLVVLEPIELDQLEYLIDLLSEASIQVPEILLLRPNEDDETSTVIISPFIKTIPSQAALTNILNSVSAKEIHNGTSLTGKMIGSWIAACSHKSELPSLYDSHCQAWNIFVNSECNAVKAEALATVTDCLASAVAEDPPILAAAFTKCATQMEEIALDIFRSETAGFKPNPVRRTVKKQLQSDISDLVSTYNSSLRTKALTHCENARKKIFSRYESTVIPTTAKTFEEFSDAVGDYIEDMMKVVTGHVCEDDVKQQMYQHDCLRFLKIYQDVVMQTVHSSELTALKESLKLEADDEKQRLVTKFKESEVVLRESITKEQSTFKRMQEATNSRRKAEEGKLRKLQTALSNSESQVISLQDKSVKDEIEIEKLQKRLVEEDERYELLRETLEAERSVCDVLRNSLHDAIKDADEKNAQAQTERLTTIEFEKSIQKSIQEKLDSTQSTLAKVTEEREELSAKLSEFFLKVSALPESLQQHFFCESVDNSVVGFADVLSGFMNE